MIRVLLLFLSISLLLLTLACGRNENANRAANNTNANANTNPSDSGTTRRDSWIALKTKLALVANSPTSGYETDVDVKEGVVTLTGKVDNSEVKSEAEQVVRKVPVASGELVYEERIERIPVERIVPCQPAASTPPPANITSPASSAPPVELWGKVNAPAIDPAQYEVKQLWYTSKDATKVPMFVVPV